MDEVTSAATWDYKTAIAAAALMLSTASLWFSWQTNQRAKKQEERKRPKLNPALLNAFVRSGNDGQEHIYAFHISISNPTDADNAVAKAELQLKYLMPQKTSMNMKIGAGSNPAHRFLPDQHKPFPIPVKIGAHDTASGWFYFPINPGALQNTQIEGHRVILTDSHGNEFMLEPIIIQEYRDDIHPQKMD